MNPKDEETVQNIRHFLRLHYEVKERLKLRAEINHKRAKQGIGDLEEYDQARTERTTSTVVGSNHDDSSSGAVGQVG
jgi:ribosomal protein L31E